jgi:hypothetical protein
MIDRSIVWWYKYDIKMISIQYINIKEVIYEQRCIK